jgi:hypothetical protein
LRRIWHGRASRAARRRVFRNPADLQLPPRRNWLAVNSPPAGIPAPWFCKLITARTLGFNPAPILFSRLASAG